MQGRRPLLMEAQRDQRLQHLRHAAASLMLAEGSSMREVMDVLVPSAMGTAANIYGHTDRERTRDAADRVRALPRRFDC